MKALVIKSFKDKKEGVTRKEGDIFILSKDRFKAINSLSKLIIKIKE